MKRICLGCGKEYDEACGYCPFCGSKAYKTSDGKVVEGEIIKVKEEQKAQMEKAANSSLSTVCMILGFITVVADFTFGIIAFLSGNGILGGICLLNAFIFGAVFFGITEALDKASKVVYLEKEIEDIKKRIK